MLATALLNQVPRPEFHNAFASVARPYIESWVAGLKGKMSKRGYEEFLASLPKDTDQRTLTHLLESLAYGNEENSDAFQLAENLKTVLGWPSDTDLVHILATALQHTKDRALRSMTIEWVMKNGVRFDKKTGSGCIFYDPSTQGNRSGTVISVDRPVAIGRVEVKDKVITVKAEQVVS